MRGMKLPRNSLRQLLTFAVITSPSLAGCEKGIDIKRDIVFNF
jgi:hypothetical protein